MSAQRSSIRFAVALALGAGAACAPSYGCPTVDAAGADTSRVGDAAACPPGAPVVGSSCDPVTVTGCSYTVPGMSPALQCSCQTVDGGGTWWCGTYCLGGALAPPDFATS